MVIVSAIVIGEIFAIGPDGPPISIIDVSHSGAVAAGLPRGEMPGLAFIERIGGHAIPPAGVLVVAAQGHDSIVVTKCKGKDPGGGFATANGSFRDGPGAPRVSGVKDAGDGTARAEVDFVAAGEL